MNYEANCFIIATTFRNHTVFMRFLKNPVYRLESKAILLLNKNADLEHTFNEIISFIM